MSSRISTKNKDVLKELEKTISPVLVVNNSSLKPYVELFEYAPENIYQQPLGTLIGFFEVKEYSDESAYIVNFLTSVLKKEYYINPKRPVTESLDSALHKVNLALSELAKHGNIGWLGKINASICVLEKNSAHFSVTGNAKIFLYRNQNLSEISDGLATDEPEPHPLKTFVNVSSGRLEKNDRLLITSADIFHILSTQELKKNFQRFEGDKFVQFLKTALSNQMEMIASIVTEMKEVQTVTKPAKAIVSKKDDVEQTINAFSGSTFANPKTKNTLASEEPTEVEAIAKEIDYTDKKTGHIYVQGEAIEGVENSNPQMGLYWDIFKEKISQSSHVTKNELRKRFYLYKKQLAKKKKLRQAEKEKRLAIEAEEKKLFEEQQLIEQAERAKQLEIEAEQEKIRLEEQRIENERLAEIQKLEEIELQKQQEKEISIVQQKVETEQGVVEKPIPVAKKLSGKKQLSDVKPIQKEVAEEAIDSKKNHELSFLEKLRLAQLEEAGAKSITENQNLTENENFPQSEQHSNLKFKDDGFNFSEEEFEESRENQELNPKLEALKSFVQKMRRDVINRVSTISQKTISATKTRFEKIKSSQKDSGINKEKITDILSPHFLKIGELYSNLSKQQKKIVFTALILIFIVPFFIARYLNKPEAIIEAPREIIAPTQAEILSQEKNISTNSTTQTIYQNSNIVTSFIANDVPIVITNTSAVVLSNGQSQEFPIPAGFGKPVRAAFMNDLALVLILSETNKVISFSPVSTKFTENKIDLSGITPSSFIGTYLTYMYVLDQKSSQILRFPRAEGGFGDKTSWLRDGTSLTEASDMTIDDNIYAIQGNQVLKFFKGQKQSFTLEASKTPVTYSKIFTTPDLQNIYVLDTVNSRVVAYSKDGSIVAQYYNEKLSSGTSLAVSEKNKTAYVSTSDSLLSITIQ